MLAVPLSLRRRGTDAAGRHFRVDPVTVGLMWGYYSLNSFCRAWGRSGLNFVVVGGRNAEVEAWEHFDSRRRFHFWKSAGFRNSHHL